MPLSRPGGNSHSLLLRFAAAAFLLTGLLIPLHVGQAETRYMDPDGGSDPLDLGGDGGPKSIAPATGNPIRIIPKNIYIPSSLSSTCTNCPTLVTAFPCGASGLACSIPGNPFDPADWQARTAQQVLVGNLPDLSGARIDFPATENTHVVGNLECSTSLGEIKSSSGENRGPAIRTFCRPVPGATGGAISLTVDMTHEIGGEKRHYTVYESAYYLNSAQHVDSEVVASSSPISSAPHCRTRDAGTPAEVMNWLVSPTNEATNQIDIAVFYTPEVRNLYKHALTLINMAVLQANQALMNSKIRAKLRIVQFQETHDGQGALNTSQLFEKLTTIGDGTFDDITGEPDFSDIDRDGDTEELVNSLRDKHGADLVFLFTLPSEVTPHCGTASELPVKGGWPTIDAESAESAYAVVPLSWKCIVEERSFARLLGNLLGVERAQGETLRPEDGASNAVTPAAYAFKGQNNSWGTLGSSPIEPLTNGYGTLVQRFSSNSLACDGTKIGSASADAAAVINQTSPFVAAYRAEVYPQLIYAIDPALFGQLTAPPPSFGLVDAITEAKKYDGTGQSPRVLVGPGEYKVNLLLERTNMKLESIGGPDVTRLDGAPSSTGPWQSPGAVRGVAITIKGEASASTKASEHKTRPEIRGFTIKNGKGVDHAGGIWVQGQASPVIAGNVFYKNTAIYGQGAALTLEGAGGEVSNNVFIENKVTGGGCPSYLNCAGTLPANERLAVAGIYVNDRCRSAGLCSTTASTQGALKIVNNILYRNEVSSSVVSPFGAAGIYFRGALPGSSASGLNVLFANNTVAGNIHPAATSGVGVNCTTLQPMVVNLLSLGNGPAVTSSSADRNLAAGCPRSGARSKQAFYDGTDPGSIFQYLPTSSDLFPPDRASITMNSLGLRSPITPVNCATDKLCQIIDQGYCSLVWNGTAADELAPLDILGLPRNNRSGIGSPSGTGCLPQLPADLGARELLP